MGSAVSHRPNLIARLVTHGLVETATFMVSFVQQYAIHDLLPVAKQRGVGTISIRPLEHGPLYPVDRALAFTLHSGVGVVLTELTSVAQVDHNLSMT